MKTLMLVALTVIFAFSCKKDNSSNNGTVGNASVKLYLTDDPSLVFDHLFLDIQKVEVKVEDSAEVENETEHEVKTPEYDVLCHMTRIVAEQC